MPDLGLDVLLKGNNMIRLLQGMWVALQISLISIVISMPLGILVGALMTMKNKIVRAIFRIYLEIIRIMPQLVLLFIVYFGSTRAFGWSLSGEVASIIVFVLWGTAEMGDLVRGALISIPKHQYESSEALGPYKNPDISLYHYSADRQTTGTACNQSDHTNDQDNQPCAYDWCCGNVESGTADYRGKSYDKSECSIWSIPCCILALLHCMLAN